jgi:uncharacterized protein YggL (DUF469 family)
MNKAHFYHLHLNRLERLLNKLNNDYEEITDENVDSAFDNFIGFFIQCYHLKDWIIQSGFESREVEEYISHDENLLICRDLANKLKHLKITKYKTSVDFVPSPTGMPMHRYLDYFTNKGRIGIAFWTKEQKTASPTDALELANSFVSSWERLINNLT